MWLPLQFYKEAARKRNDDLIVAQVRRRLTLIWVRLATSFPVLGQIVTLALPSVVAAAATGHLSVGGIISQVIAGGAWRGNTDGDHWRN